MVTSFTLNEMYYNNKSSIVAFHISLYLAYATGHNTGKIVKVVWEKFSDFLWFQVYLQRRKRKRKQ